MALMNKIEEAIHAKNVALLQSIKAALPQLEELLREVNDHWTYEDGIYRFYHQSFKVFYLQATTLRVVSALQAIAPDVELNPWFLEVVKQGTGREFDPRNTNAHWTEETRPILEAFFHARFLLEMVCKYGRELEAAPLRLPSGWAAVLYLYRMR